MRKAPAAVDKKLIHFTSFEEMSSRPHFVSVVDPKEVKLEDAIGVYQLPTDSRIACGLSDCRTKHGFGLLMVTADGVETNIGNRCGVKKFHVDFQRIKNAAMASDRRERYRDKIRGALDSRAEFHANIDALMSAPKGARWLAKAKSNFERLIPSEACYVIRKMAKERAPGVFRARYKTKQEMEIEREFQGALGRHISQYKMEQVGTLAGLDFWASDLRALIVDDLQTEMRDLEKIDVAELNSIELRKRANWVDQIPHRVAEAERLLAEGAQFFTASNLELVHFLSTEERRIDGLDESLHKMSKLLD